MLLSLCTHSVCVFFFLCFTAGLPLCVPNNLSAETTIRSTCQRTTNTETQSTLAYTTLCTFTPLFVLFVFCFCFVSYSRSVSVRSKISLTRQNMSHMSHMSQEIPKIKGSTILSTLDVASGFWTIPVHPDDQHKLAFTFGNRQYTFTRCPFGYANSPAEFNIFLNKACPDARVRGNLVYVDDVLMKSSSVEDHLKEIDHVLNQLTTAGAKIALHKGQWCKTKVNYVGLLVGRNGIEPQSNRAQAIQSIKTPTNVSELRSFLGVCNYSRQFIENYSDIARPLTSLLKKDEPFVWTKAQDTAMSQLKQCLRSAPCLAYPDPGKEFYLDAGFSDQCLSAGLYQLHDKDKRVVAYASKTLLPPECKYSHCEKALLCTVWGIQRFSNYIGAQKVIIETCHQPVTFLNSQRIRDGVVTNARIATWLMTLQGRDVEARYAQNYKSSLGNGLAACQNCSTDTLDTSAEPKNCHDRKRQIIGTSRRMCVQECPQHMSMAAHTIARASYKRERVWSGSTMTRAHRSNSNLAHNHHNMQK